MLAQQEFRRSGFAEYPQCYPRRVKSLNDASSDMGYHIVTLCPHLEVTSAWRKTAKAPAARPKATPSVVRYEGMVTFLELTIPVSDRPV